ncbi:MAG: hypothetical protein ACOH2R_24095 [Pseudomonas sp.]
MTDLPNDQKHVQHLDAAFQRLLALKARHQAEKRKARQAWKHWYASLDEAQKVAVDEQVGRQYEAIAAQFGPSRRYHPSS